MADGTTNIIIKYKYHEYKLTPIMCQFVEWKRIRTVYPQSLLGSLLLLIGRVKGFFKFIPVQLMKYSISCKYYKDRFFASKFLFQKVKVINLFKFALFIFGLSISLILLISTPIVVNIALHHMILVPTGLGIALVMVVLDQYMG